ncbi:MAG: hypothetical protein GQ565_08200 [Candidatus Aegiribacteria sp.]|nr:hypothetical protein [Candidatus Aegiribacteria sp.]
MKGRISRRKTYGNASTRKRKKVEPRQTEERDDHDKSAMHEVIRRQTEQEHHNVEFLATLPVNSVDGTLISWFWENY